MRVSAENPCNQTCCAATHLRKSAKAVGGRRIQAGRHIDVNCVVIVCHWCPPHLRLRGNRDGDGLTDQDLNIKAVLLDTAADAGGAVPAAIRGGADSGLSSYTVYVLGPLRELKGFCVVASPGSGHAKPCQQGIAMDAKHSRPQPFSW